MMELDRKMVLQAKNITSATTSFPGLPSIELSAT
jgi:hypothetical protein